MPDSSRFVHLPKAELHVHLDGSLRPQTLLELAREAEVGLPAHSAAELRRQMRVDGARNLDEYLERFAHTVAVLQRPEAIERVAFEMVEDAARDGIRYLEVRYCPALSRPGGLSLDQVIAAEATGLRRGAAAFGVRTGMINCILRHFVPELSVEIAEASVRCRSLGVVGFDLAGGEAHHAAAPHREAFGIAAAGGLGITVHAGEAAGPESIAEAIHLCGAQRIGHATRLVEDPELLALVRDRRIPLEINVTSNVQTGVVASPERHPLRAFLDRGVVVTLCSDNWLMSDVTLSGEYALAERALGLTAAEFHRVAHAGFAAAFLPADQRVELEREVANLIEAFR
jgi:adenosine deaminase